MITIESTNVLLEVIILNMQGQVVLKSQLQKIDISGLANGFYVCMISTINGQQTAKLSIAK